MSSGRVDNICDACLVAKRENAIHLARLDVHLGDSVVFLLQTVPNTRGEEKKRAWGRGVGGSRGKGRGKREGMRGDGGEGGGTGMQGPDRDVVFCSVDQPCFQRRRPPATCGAFILKRPLPTCGTIHFTK